MKKPCYTDYVKKITRTVEVIIISILILMMTAILIFTTFQLGVFLYKTLFLGSGGFNLDTSMDLFGGFLIVLIGIELLDTIKVYLKSNVIHVEVVILVAIIALARKIIILKVEEYTGFVIVGIGVLILALTSAYYLIRKAGLMTIMMENDPEVEMPEKFSNQVITPVEKPDVPDCKTPGL
jgi:uncharacterized membrane protein (DUF373 family)